MKNLILSALSVLLIGLEVSYGQPQNAVKVYLSNGIETEAWVSVIDEPAHYPFKGTLSLNAVEVCNQKSTEMYGGKWYLPEVLDLFTISQQLNISSNPSSLQIAGTYWTATQINEQIATNIYVEGLGVSVLASKKSDTYKVRCAWRK